MDADHDRYAELAVGHVLGGLSVGDARQFQVHLMGCGECRTRVAELRDIASELEAAEQDERSRSQLRTELEQRVDDGEAGVAPTRKVTVGHVTVAVVVVLVLAIGVLFWNLHLRTTVAGYDQLLVAQSEALAVLTGGTALPVDLAEGISGMIATDGERIAFSLAGLDVNEGETVSAWTIDEDGGASEFSRASAALVRRGGFAGVVDRDGVEEVVVTLQSGAPGDQPDGQILARGQL